MQVVAFAIACACNEQGLSLFISAKAEVELLGPVDAGLFCDSGRHPAVN
jgi:hypothetical protein